MSTAKPQLCLLRCAHIVDFYIVALSAAMRARDSASVGEIVRRTLKLTTIDMLFVAGLRGRSEVMIWHNNRAIAVIRPDDSTPRPTPSPEHVEAARKLFPPIGSFH